MKLGQIKGVAVAAVAAMLLLGTAESASAKPVRPDAAALKFVDKNKLSIAREVIRTFRHTARSRREVTRHTGQMMGMSHRNVTNIQGEIAARLAFRKGQKGTYDYSADFKGAIKPKNFLGLYVSTNQARNREEVFGMGLWRTELDGGGTPRSMHWFLSAVYTRNSRETWYSFDSCGADGGPGGNKPVLSEPSLIAAVRQMRKVLRHASQRRPIRRQKDVLAGRVRPNLQTCKPTGIL